MNKPRRGQELHPVSNSICISGYHEGCSALNRFSVAVAVLIMLSCSLASVSAQDGQAANQQLTAAAGKQQFPEGLGNFGGVSNGGTINDSNADADNSTFTTEANESGAAATPLSTNEKPGDDTAPVQVPFPAAAPALSPPTTTASTLAVSSFELPESVDIAECRKRLQVVDANRDSLLNEEEFVKFVQQVAAHDDTNHTLVDLPSRDLWGNSLRDMPRGVRLLYNNLNQGGVVEIVGYKVNQIPKPTLAQELFLVKICVHTEIVVYQILKQDGQSGINIDASQQVISLPNADVVTVYSSFALSNRVGITTAALNPDASHSRRGLELAYQTLVTHVVGEEVGVTLTKPKPEAAPDGAEGQEATRGRRRLTVALDQQLPEIYRIDDVLCPGALPTSSPELQTVWCQVAYGKFLLYLVAEDSLEVYNDYSRAVQNATSSGDLQDILNEVAPNVEVKVTGAGESILPPPASLSPASPSEPSPSPTNLTDGNSDTDGAAEVGASSDRKTKLGMIFPLAAVLMSVNCCIISVSMCMCYRNRNYHGHDLDEGLGDMYQSYRKEPKEKRRSKGGRRDSSNSYFGNEGEEIESLGPPSFQDIAAANAPVSAPYSTQDAQERERILGQAESSQSNISMSSVAAPTREEIQATLTAASASGSPQLALSSDTSCGVEKSYRADSGEMA